MARFDDLSTEEIETILENYGNLIWVDPMDGSGRIMLTISAGNKKQHTSICFGISAFRIEAMRDALISLHDNLFNKILNLE